MLPSGIESIANRTPLSTLSSRTIYQHPVSRLRNRQRMSNVIYSRPVVRRMQAFHDLNAHVEDESLSDQRALLHAASCGDATQLRRLLEHMPASGVALRLACGNSHPECARLLLQKGADLESLSVFGRSALVMACTAGCTETTLLLLDAGATASTDALCAASQADKLDCVKLLLRFGASPNHGDPLSAACAAGATSCARELLEAGAECNGRGTDSPLALAAEGGYKRCLRLLLSHGARVDDERVRTSALARACNEGHKACARLLLRAGASANVRPGFTGWSPLAIAVSGGWTGCVRLLIRANADVTRITPEGATPLMIACSNDSPGCVRLLLLAGAPPDTVHPRLRGGSNCALSLACYKPSMGCVTRLLQAGADPDGGEEGQPPLFTTCHTGDEQCLQLLIDAGATRVQYHTETALMVACSKGHLGCVRKLLAHFVGSTLDVNLQDEGGLTALMYSCAAKSPLCVEALLGAGADPCRTSTDGSASAALVALCVESRECMEILLRYGLSLERKGRCGRTALMEAACIGEGQVRLMLSLGAASFDTADTHGNTAHQLALQHGEFRAAALLLGTAAVVTAYDTTCAICFEQMESACDTHTLACKHCFHWACWKRWQQQGSAPTTTCPLCRTPVNGVCEVVCTESRRSGSPLMFAACAVGHRCCMRWLIWCNPEESYHRSRHLGRTPLLEACAHGQVACVNYLLHILFANPDEVCGEDSETPSLSAAMLSARHSSSKCLKALVHADADLSTTDKDGSTALMHASGSGSLACVKLLLGHGVTVDAVDRRGRTALMRACMVGATGCADALLQEGADVHASDYSGRTPIAWAYASDSLECAQLLLNVGASADSARAGGPAALVRARKHAFGASRKRKIPRSKP